MASKGNHLGSFFRPIYRVIVNGQTGSGKTHWTREITKDTRRLVIYDPCEDYTDIAQPMFIQELKRDPKILARENVRVAIQPYGSSEREMAEEIETLRQILYAAGDCVAVFDEIGDYGKYCDDCLSRIARNGRHYGIAMVAISQCAIEIPKRVRRQATHWVSFVQTNPDDLKAIEKQCGSEYVAKIHEWRARQPPVIWSLPSLEGMENQNA